MWKGFAFIAVVSLLALTSAPSAVAFHGTPYRASGLACLGGAAPCYPVVVEWGGGYFRLGIGIAQEPPLPSAMLVPLGTIPGREIFTNVFFAFAPWCGASTEFTDYHGFDNQGGGVFDVVGSQDNCLSDGVSRQIQLTGHYQQIWHLSVSYGMLLP